MLNRSVLSVLIVGLFLITAGCGLDSRRDNFETDERVQELLAVYSGIEGLYRGTLERKNIVSEVEIMLQTRSTLDPSQRKSDGTLQDLPVLVGGLRYLDGRVESIEYMDFVASFNQYTGELIMDYTPSGEPHPLFGAAEKHTIKGFITEGYSLQADLLNRSAQPMGQFNLEKVTDRVVGLSSNEREEEYRDRMREMGDRFMGLYKGKVRRTTGEQPEEIDFIVDITFDRANAAFRANIRTASSSAINSVRVDVSYIFDLDRITFRGQSQNQNVRFSSSNFDTRNINTVQYFGLSALSSFGSGTFSASGRVERRYETVDEVNYLVKRLIIDEYNDHFGQGSFVGEYWQPL